MWLAECCNGSNSALRFDRGDEICIVYLLMFILCWTARTIAQNIAYGAASSGASAGVKDLGGVSMEKVTDAAELANAKEFIEEFPDG